MRRTAWRSVCLLAAIAAGCHDTPPPDPTASLAAGFAPWPEGEARPEVSLWYRVNFFHQEAGRAQLTVTGYPTPAGPARVTQLRQEWTVRRAGTPVWLSERTRVLLDSDGAPIRLEHEESQAEGGGVRLIAGRIGAQMVCARGVERRQEPFDPDAIDGLLPWQSLKLRGLTPDSPAARVRFFSPASGAYAELTARRLSGATEDETAVWYELIASDQPEVRLRLRLDRDGQPAQMLQLVGGLQLRFVRTTDPPAPVAADRAPDLERWMHLVPDRFPAAPERVQTARYRLRPLPAELRALDWSGPGQRLLDRDDQGVRLEVSRLGPPPTSPFPPKITDPALRAYLAPSAATGGADTALVELAAQLSAGAPDAWSAAERLRHWVSESIATDMGMAFAPAAEVLRRRHGDCSEKSVLLVGLARAAGLPARAVVGLVAHRGRFSGHMWVEMWTGEWRPLDPSLGPALPSAARIRLAEVTLELGQAERAGTQLAALLTSGAGLVVEEMEEEAP